MIIGLDDSGKTSILNVLISSSAAAPAAGKPNRAQQQSPGLRQSKLNSGRSHLDSVEDIDLAHVPNQPMGLGLVDAGNGGNREVRPTIGYNYERIQYRDQVVNVLDFSGQSKYRGLWQEFFNCVDGIVFVIDSSDLIRLVVVQDELETLLSHPFFATISPNAAASRQLPAGGHETVTTTPRGDDNPPGRSQLAMAHQLAQKQVTISQGKLIQSPLTDRPNAQASTGAQAARGLRTKIPILFLANKTDLASSADTTAIAEALNLEQVPKERHPWLIKATSVRTNQGIFEGFDWLLSEILATS